MELLQLRYFCDAAKNEKFSQTAKNFLVPVSNISQSIKRLEKELGVELFDHKGNRVTLNNDGRRFYEYVSKSLKLLENAKKCISDADDDFDSDIRLVCENTSKMVSAAIERFLEKYPNVNFIITQDYDENYDFDVLISDIFPKEHGKKILLFEEDIYVIMNKKHKLTNKNTVTVGDLENERFITSSSSPSMKNIIVKACEEAGFSPNFAIQTHATTYLRRYIDIGLGISFAPTSWTKNFSNNFSFKKLEGLTRKNYAFVPKSNRKRRLVEAFLETLKTEVDSIVKLYED